MNYSACVLDVHDDGGKILQDLVPDMSQIPSFVKTASEEVNENSPNALFALVLIEDGQVLKKYATAGKGHTWLSSVYFAKTAHQLPEEAQRIAATYLKNACEGYGLPVIDEIDKIAYDALESNIIDVTGASPASSSAPIEAVETTYAIDRADGTQAFPLSNAGSIAAADRYFEANARRFHPRDRREYAVKVAHVNREKTGFALCASLEQLSGDTYGNQIKSAIGLRRIYLTNDGASPETLQVLDKVASARHQLAPESFAELLNEFDEAADLDRYWDRGVPDPWYSTFGLVKEAKGSVPGPRKVIAEDGDSLSEQAIINAAERKFGVIKEYFGEKIAIALRANPVAVYKSLPLPQKRIMARLLSSLAADG